MFIWLSCFLSIFCHLAVHGVLYSLLRWTNRHAPEHSSRSQGGPVTISYPSTSSVSTLSWQEFSWHWGLPGLTLFWHTAQFHLISAPGLWLTLESNMACWSCSLDAAHAPFLTHARFHFRLSRLRHHPPCSTPHLQFGTNYFLWVTCLNSYIQVTYFDSFWQQRL